MNDDLEAIDGLCAKIIDQRDRIWALEAALRKIGSFPYVGEKAAQQMALIANDALDRKDST